MALELSAQYKALLDNGKFQSLCSHAPWPHFILDDLIPTDQFTVLQQRLIRRPKSFESVNDHPAKIQLCYMEDLELAEFFFSDPVRDLFEGIAGCPLFPHEQLAIQFRQMTPSSPEFPPHVDLIDTPSLVALYYVAPDWTLDKGGEIILLDREDQSPSEANAKWVAPKQNRLLLFRSESHHWHMVRRVHNWRRLLVLTEWLTKKDEAQ